MYKEASKLKLRFNTPRGVLSTEQLWDLSLEDLDKLAVSLKKAYKESGEKSFLVKKSKKDKELKLMFDIALDILTTKVEERDAMREEAETKAFNQKIDEIIAAKKDEELKSLSVKELEKLRKQK